MAQNIKNNKNKSSKHQNKRIVQEKLSQKRKVVAKQSSVLPWLLGIFLIIGAITSVLIYDTNVYGDGIFEKSSTGKFLKDLGVLPYVETTWYTVMSCCARAYKQAEIILPPFYEKVSLASKPYIGLSKDLFKIGLNTLENVWESLKDVIQQKGPVVSNYIEQYVPGLPKSIYDITVSTWTTSVQLYKSSFDYLKSNIFVGNLSPENLSKALNETRIVAAKYIIWFHEKIDAYAKIN